MYAPDNTQPDHSQTLNHIAEVSKNARAIWFSLIGLCLFVGVTLLGHEDADFFAFGAVTTLPLVNVDIPVRSFFVFAPVLVAALYIYLHLYLMSLWDALANLKQEKGAAPIADRVYPWLISHAALWYRNRHRKAPDGGPEGSSAPRPMGRFVVFISLLLGFAFGLFVLAALWYRSLPAHDEWLTLWIGFCLFLATLVGLTGVASAMKRMADRSPEDVTENHGVRFDISAVFAATLFFLS